MTAKEYLKKIYYLDRKIKRLREQRADLEGMLYSVGLTSPGFDKERVQTSRRQDKMAELVADVEAKDKEIVQQTRRLIREKEKIIRQIEQLPDQKYVDILFYRYVRLCKWEDIARVMSYAETYVRHALHAEALDEFARRFKDLS